MKQKSDSERALESIKVNEDKLTAGKIWPHTKNAVEARQRFIRDGRIYRAWVKADDKESEVQRLSEVWGLQPGHITGIIDRIKGGDRRIPIEILAEINALEAFKREEILDDGARAREEIDAQIAELEEARLGGTKSVEVEDNDGKTKTIPINRALMQLHAQKMKIYGDEGSAVAQYKRRPPQEIHTTGLNVTIQADADFQHEFERAMKMKKEVKDAEFEVEEEDQ